MNLLVVSIWIILFAVTPALFIAHIFGFLPLWRLMRLLERILSPIFRILILLRVGRLLPKRAKVGIHKMLYDAETYNPTRMPEDIRHLWLYLEDTLDAATIKSLRHTPPSLLWDVYRSGFVDWQASCLISGRLPTKRRLKKAARRFEVP